MLDTFIPSCEMLDYLQKAVLMIHPPVYDAYGMTIAEAAAVSTPTVIHENHIGASSLFRSHENEILTTDFGNVETACAKIQDMLEQPQMLEKIGENAQRRSLSWTTTEYAKQLDAQLKQLTNT